MKSYEDELSDYNKLMRCKTNTCVGFIKYGEEVSIFGKVKIIDSSDEKKMISESTRFIRWMEENLGAEYIPN